MSDCCPTTDQNKKLKSRIDPILHGSLLAIGIAVLLSALLPGLPYVTPYADAALELLGTMWWGIVLGILFVGIMGEIPRDYFTAVLGRGDRFSGIIRATIAGLFLDLCSHGIVMVGAKLYERGASLAQVMAFLIASPWNSLSLTVILFALIGAKWTLIYIAGSALIAIITGVLYAALIKAEKLPQNPNAPDYNADFNLWADIKARSKNFKLDRALLKRIGKNGWHEASMLLRWLLLGVVIAAAIRTFVPADIFATWFGPSVIGLLLTLGATTLIEVCSEGSAPIASELVNRAAAPGNGFTFLMAGVSTDYTEMMVIREFSKSWKIALSLPLLTVPQVLILGYIMNLAGG